ncbi:hypothetical protein ACLKA6_015921 [Drosophila palustris]
MVCTKQPGDTEDPGSGPGVPALPEMTTSPSSPSSWSTNGPTLQVLAMFLPPRCITKLIRHFKFSTWPVNSANPQRPRGSSSESAQATASRRGRSVHSPYNSDQSQATPPNAEAGDVEAVHGRSRRRGGRLDWVPVPAGWCAFGLGAHILGVVVDSVEVSRPKALMQGQKKLVVEADGQRFQIRIARGGQVTVFLRPP